MAPKQKFHLDGLAVDGVSKVAWHGKEFSQNQVPPMAIVMLKYCPEKT
jgi:hypothetical protein